MLLDRLQRFFRGEWLSLLQEARNSCSHGGASNARSEEEESAHRREVAVSNVQRGELSKARRVLTAAALAPGTSDTLRQLTDPERRPPHSETPISTHVFHRPTNARIKLDKKFVFEALRGARKGSAAGLSGMATTHLKPLLENEYCMELLGSAADLFLSLIHI